MNEEFSDDKINEPPDFEEKSDNDLNDPVVNPVDLTDELPSDEDLVEEMNSPEQEPLVERTTPITIPLPTEEKSVVSRSVFYNTPMDETLRRDESIDRPTQEPATLFEREESELLRTRWKEIQGKFVDEPLTAVQEADKLVTEVMETITRIFAVEYGDLESQWKQSEVASTEDLRKAMQHYRAFFNRLVG
jgi:hypothetical protein